MDNLAVNKNDLHIRRVDQECQFITFFSAFIYTNLKRLVKRKQMFVIFLGYTTTFSAAEKISTKFKSLCVNR